MKAAEMRENTEARTGKKKYKTWRSYSYNYNNGYNKNTDLPTESIFKGSKSSLMKLVNING